MTELSAKDKNISSFYRDMTFPLNVYAHALFLEEGQVSYLHYGLFQETNTRLQDAQFYSTQLVLAELPKLPCRILEVGVGLGTTLKLLTDMGYQAYGMSPDSEQINYVNKQWGGDAPVQCQKFEDFTAVANSYEVILFQESAQYIDPLSIFNQCLDCLVSSGSLIILDEFSLDKESGFANLHTLDDLLVLAQRFGFKLIKQQDLSTLAAPTLDYLLKLTQKHRQKLMADLNLSSEQLKQLDESNRIYKNHYTQGRYGYALLHFKQEKHPKWHLKPFNYQHFNKIQDLFRLSFNQTVSADFWQWKYASDQARRLCVWEKNELIAHYGGIPRDILYFSKNKTAVQIGDVMVHPSGRGILTRTGPFFRLAASFLEQYIGFGKSFLLGFGFPNERAMKVAEHLGLYTEVGHMLEISWPVVRSRPGIFSYLRFIDKNNVQNYIDTINVLWQAMADDLHNAIVGVRDSAYLLNRYLNHPQQSYQVIVIKNRMTAKPYGIVILHINDRRCDIVDIISPLKNIPVLIFHAQRLAANRQCEQLFCQISNNFAACFTTSHSSSKAMDIRIPCNTWTSGPKPEIIKNHWWLMGGDMDFR